MIVQGIKDKIAEQNRKIDLQESAMNDLGEKTDELKDQIRERQREINEMKRTIEAKAN